MEELNQIRDALERMCPAPDTRLATAIQNCDVIRTQLAAKDAEIERLRDEANAARVEVTDMKQEHLDMANTVERLKEAKADLLKRSVSLSNQCEELDKQLAAKDAEIERLRNYRARMEGAHGDKLYAIEHLLDHFDEEGNLKGDGQWRIRAIWKCCKDFGEGSERAAKLSGESLLSQLAAKDAMLAAATEFEFPNNLRLVQCSDGSWHVWMPGQPGAFKKTLAEAHDAAQAAGWLSQEAKGGTT